LKASRICCCLWPGPIDPQRYRLTSSKWLAATACSAYLHWHRATMDGT
jgi:hypothetical protein